MKIAINELQLWKILQLSFAYISYKHQFLSNFFWGSKFAAADGRPRWNAPRLASLLRKKKERGGKWIDMQE
jgi:hypothetical protein